MNNKSYKVVEDNRLRQQIISDNIVYFIKKKNIKQIDFYTSMNINKQDFSKKKNNKGSSFSTEEIYLAAKILDVTVNDLYYSNEEKKEIVVLKENVYNPIMAQKQIEVKHIKSSFKEPMSILCITISLAILLSIINYFILKKSPFWILLVLSIPAIALYDFKSSFGVDRTYWINYLDDVYYKINDVKNKYYDLCKILHLLSLIITLICMLIIIDNNYYLKMFPIYSTFFIIYSLINVLISSIILIFFKEKEMKKKIYEYEINGYISKLVLVIISSIFSVFGIGLLSFDVKKCWFISVLSLLPFIFSIIEFILISKKYSEYKMVYKKYGEDEVELFPDDYII